MNVNLTPELEQLVQDKVASGHYVSQSEVVREALRLLADQDRLREVHVERLREALADGLQQADRNELFDGAELVAEMRERYGSRRATPKQRSNSKRRSKK